jgi:hypothetical protein
VFTTETRSHGATEEERPFQGRVKWEDEWALAPGLDTTPLPRRFVQHNAARHSGV